MCVLNTTHCMPCQAPKLTLLLQRAQCTEPMARLLKHCSALQVIGKSAGFAVPVLVVLLLLVGLFAASSYDSGATAVLKP